jgi:hypothetical protein
MVAGSNSFAVRSACVFLLAALPSSAAAWAYTHHAACGRLCPGALLEHLGELLCQRTLDNHDDVCESAICILCQHLERRL